MCWKSRNGSALTVRIAGKGAFFIRNMIIKTKTGLIRASFDCNIVVTTNSNGLIHAHYSSYRLEDDKERDFRSFRPIEVEDWLKAKDAQARPQERVICASRNAMKLIPWLTQIDGIRSFKADDNTLKVIWGRKTTPISGYSSFFLSNPTERATKQPSLLFSSWIFTSIYHLISMLTQI